MSPRLALSPNDSLWLNMDTPENLMVIEGVMWFDEPLDRTTVTEVLAERLVGRYPVFSWRAEASESTVGLDHWVSDPDFVIDRHIAVHDLGDAGREGFQRFLEDRMSEPLPRDRPLWQAHVLNGTDFGAVMLRFHHAIADGTALVRVLLDLTTETPDGVAPASEPPAGIADTAPLPTHNPLLAHPIGEHRAPRKRDRATRTLGQIVTLPLAAGVAVTTSAVTLVQHLDPDHETSLVRRLADQALGTADAVDKLVVGVHPDLSLFGQPGLAKRADWAPPYDLAEVKRAARAQGVTVNDLMMAGMSGALRRYLLDLGEVPHNVVTMIPVNLRSLDEPLPVHLGNKFALVAFELPLTGPTPLERLAQSKAGMDVIKAGPEAMLTFGLSHAIGAVGSVTSTASRLMTQYFSNKAVGVTTNVPGPTSARYFAGQEMRGILGWVPGASHQTLGACIISYNGQIRVGFKTDATVIPDVGSLVRAFDDEMHDLLAEAVTG